MNKETIRSLNKIKNLSETTRQFKRYMRVAEAERNYQMDRRMLTDIAIAAGALYKINSITLVDMDLFEAYFEENFKVSKEKTKKHRNIGRNT